MKAQPTTPTLFVNHNRLRAIVILFAGLLVLAAAIIGSIFAFSRGAPTAEISARTPSNHLLIAHCRPCQDEALAARQGAGLAGEQPSLSSVVSSPPHTLTINCRACRDEVWGASQASFSAIDRHIALSQLDDTRGPGPR
jgi:hypothetical protein